MRNILLFALILLIISCNKKPEGFDLQTQEFKNEKSSFFSSSLRPNMIEGEEKKEDVKPQVIESIKKEVAISDVEVPNKNSQPPSQKTGILSGLFGPSAEELDALDNKINECEEKLYINSDELADQKHTINSLFNERNELLKQLDSLQTEVDKIRRNSRSKVRNLESEQTKLHSLIDILSKEIE